MLLTHDFPRDLTHAPDTVYPSLDAGRGLMAGTRVETETGWRDVADLTAGDRLYTLDGDLRPIQWVERFAGGDDAVRLRAGTYGNDIDTLLPEEQLLLVETGRAMAWINAPVALVRARDLIGHGAARRPLAAGEERILPVFAEEEVIFAASGLRVFCPGITGAAPTYYPVLERSEAVEVLGETLLAAA